jgi:hypothetical protein
MPQVPPPVLKPTSRQPVIFGVLVTILLIAVGGFFAWPYVREIIDARITTLVEQQEQQLTSARTAMVNGDFNGAIQLAEPLLQTDDAETRKAAQATLALSSFSSGDREARIAAVRLMKDKFASANTDLERALALNALLAYILTGEDAYVLDEVFAGEPYASLRVEGDMPTSLRKLAEFSLSFYETPQALQRVAFWYAARLTNFDKKYTLTKTERTQYQDTVVTLIQRIDRSYDDYQNATTYTYPFQLTTSRAFWDTYLYATLARTGRVEYLAKSKESLDELVRIAQMTTGEDGKPIPLASLLVPEARLIYATALHIIKKDASVDEVRAQLDAAVDFTQENLELEAGNFIALIKTIAAAPAQHAYMEKLAAIDQKFYNLLVQYGWKPTASSTVAQ